MLLIFIFVIYISSTQCARILAVFPTPSISHQIVFRPLTQELARRGHELIILTPNPAFPKGQAPKNIIEIDVHNESYAIKNQTTKEAYEKDTSSLKKVELLSQLFVRVFRVQLENEEFRTILKLDKDYFDLLLVEACVTPALGLSHIFKAPVIQVSSMGALMSNYEALGIPMHLFFFPSSVRKRSHNLSLTEKLSTLVEFAVSKYVMRKTRNLENNLLREHFGDNIPSLDELTNNIDMLFLNTNPLWANNYPVPSNVIFIGGMLQNARKDLPKDLEAWLNSSKNGVIYVSFGSNVSNKTFSHKTKHVLSNVLSNSPYDVLLKWDEDVLIKESKNIRIGKWFPQSDLLYHSKIKLFITQGGLQSTDEAIAAGVPMIGIPIFVDQAYNTEQYEHFNIGARLNYNELTEEKLKETIDTVIEDEKYRNNIIKLRKIINDQPQSPLDKAVWWTEYVIRNNGAQHLKSPTANISWIKYLEIELVATLTIILLSFITFLILTVKFLVRITIGMFRKLKVKRD
ncbi:Ecdysteroid UDP-glucosyltransferase [Papilio xuthus]|uniref:UDP-glucuronosyltransferase n=1 Tax=Papilio xuthus TaxID=66420 RepID=A0A0N1IMZ0_PAPXU|nr:Ecdysteroid UDP-glucosyltransferase [Papilio xuthus]